MGELEDSELLPEEYLASLADLPGFTTPLFKQHSGKFQTIVYPPDIQERCTSNKTCWESAMIRSVNAIIGEPDWNEKIFDQDIARGWWHRFLDAEEKLTPEMMDFVIEEVKFKAMLYQQNGMIVALDGDVVMSDLAISQEVKSGLQAAVVPLEDVPDQQKDYAPGSNGQVRNLVDPALFPLIYGRSQILLPFWTLGLGDYMSNKGCAVALAQQDDPLVDPDVYFAEMFRDDLGHMGNIVAAYSLRSQWLPCEVVFNEAGDKCTIASYVNNLHPKQHQSMYKVIEKILASVIPLWNVSLGPVSHGCPLNRSRVKLTHIHYLPSPTPPPLVVHSNRTGEFRRRLFRWTKWKMKRPVKPPKVQPFDLWREQIQNEAQIELRDQFRNEGLQLIVKLSNIELIPEKPQYEERNWHSAGVMNEHICATAIYHYSCENITTPAVSFRQRFSTHNLPATLFEELGSPWIEQVFDRGENDPQVQNLGTVSCPEGRLLTFPNSFQTRLAPFELLDRTKPGSCKSLILYLVDPHCRIISTANIPPQQAEWWELYVLTIRWVLSEKGLPVELQDMILSYLDPFTLTLEEAKHLRLIHTRERELKSRLESDLVEYLDPFLAL